MSLPIEQATKIVAELREERRQAVERVRIADSNVDALRFHIANYSSRVAALVTQPPDDMPWREVLAQANQYADDVANHLLNDLGAFYAEQEAADAALEKATEAQADAKAGVQ